jgi:hypothetical protein
MHVNVAGFSEVGRSKTVTTSVGNLGVVGAVTTTPFATGLREPVIEGALLSSFTVTEPLPLLPRRSVAVASSSGPPCSPSASRSPASAPARPRSLHRSPTRFAPSPRVRRSGAGGLPPRFTRSLRGVERNVQFEATGLGAMLLDDPVVVWAEVGAGLRD